MWIISTPHSHMNVYTLKDKTTLHQKKMLNLAGSSNYPQTTSSMLGSWDDLLAKGLDVIVSYTNTPPNSSSQQFGKFDKKVQFHEKGVSKVSSIPVPSVDKRHQLLLR